MNRLMTLMIGVLFAGTAAPATASAALGGIDGGLDFPSSEVRPDGTMTLGVGYAGTSASYVFPPYSNRFYFLSTRVLPGLEICARFTEVLGFHDPSILLPNYVDRMISAKWAPPMPTGWPSLAIGGIDLFSINELNNLPGLAPGTTRYGISAYAVAGYRLGPVRWEVGYGQGKSYLQGPFTSLKLQLLEGLEGLMEYGNGRFNAGVGLPAGGFDLKAGYLQGKELGIASTYTFHL